MYNKLTYMDKKTHVLVGLAWFIIIAIGGYLLCSLFSLDFDISEWNIFSKIVGSIFVVMDFLVLKDAIFEKF